MTKINVIYVDSLSKNEVVHFVSGAGMMDVFKSLGQKLFSSGAKKL